MDDAINRELEAFSNGSIGSSRSHAISSMTTSSWTVSNTKNFAPNSNLGISPLSNQVDLNGEATTSIRSESKLREEIQKRQEQIREEARRVKE